jgi:predicted DNA-binding transcriptional regulator AlpA
MQHKISDRITAEEAAAILGRSVATLYRIARADGLRRERLLGRVVFVREEIERLALDLKGRGGTR